MIILIGVLRGDIGEEKYQAKTVRLFSNYKKNY